MKNLLVKLALWIMKHYSYYAYWVPKELNPVLSEAVKLEVLWDAKAPTASGEFKRHQVYSSLMKKFPTIPNRDLAMAIELAIQGIKK